MKKLLFVFLQIVSALSFAQGHKYWIQFSTTSPTQFKEEVNQLEDSISIVNTSHWLKAVSAKLSSAQKITLEQSPKITAVFPVSSYELQQTGDLAPNEFEIAFQQMNAQAIMKDGLTGQGVKIGIIDAGFTDCDSLSYFQHIFENNQVIAHRDFLDSTRSDFYNEVTYVDYHGEMVWKRIAGYEAATDSTKEIFYGLAKNAKFYLARTEHGISEGRMEEDTWISSIEWLHSQGVRLVNSSLGYSDKMDDEEENYIPAQMDGKTTMISKAAQIATEEKNMIIVSSAGNSGDDKDWLTLTAPADAEGVISIGATNKYMGKAKYSSIGMMGFTTFLKPEVSVYSPNGTSFAAPIITGLIACMLEKDSTLSSQEIKNLLQKSAHLNKYPNNYVGYGVPQTDEILALMNQEALKSNYSVERVSIKGKKFKITPSKLPKQVVLFQKMDTITVKKQILLRDNFINKNKNAKYGKIKGGVFSKKIIIRKTKGIKFTTVYFDKHIIEIKWD
ncbi:MAG: S8 family serine peptidase [Cytophagales bacterium]|nr:S8 family serine peptidase [Cytophagales bacterium]